MTDGSVIRLSLQVFEDDDPALVARLRALPKSKVRRREHLIRLLGLGVAAEARGGLAVPSPAALPVPTSTASANTTVTPEAPAVIPDASSATEPDKRRSFDTVLDPEDLATIFALPTPSPQVGA